MATTPTGHAADSRPPIKIILIAASFAKADLGLPVRAQFFPKPVQHQDVTAAMHRMAPRSDA